MEVCSLPTLPANAGRTSQTSWCDLPSQYHHVTDSDLGE